MFQILNAAIDHIFKKNEKSHKISATNEELNSIAGVYSQYCSNQLTKSEMLDSFPVKNEFKDCVLNAVELRKQKICDHLMSIHNSQNSPLMTSFDWDIKFILGNSSLASHREQKATLIFECDHRNNPETISVEMRKEMIDKMIKELESVSQAI
jgi:COMM domain containing 8